MIFKKIKSTPKMLKVLKLSSIGLFSLVFVLYLSFLFILPNVVNINNFLPQINSEIEKQTGFKVALENPKLKTTWRLGVKVLANKVSVKYFDDSDFVVLTSPAIEINLPTLVFRHLNLDKIYFKDARVSLIFNKDKKYTIENHINKIVSNAQEQKSQEVQQQLPIELKNINIEIQNTKITLKDENVEKTYILNANNSKISMPSLKGPLRLSTSGFLGEINAKENFVDFNIKLQTKLPETPQGNEKQPQNIDFDFNFNPLVNVDKFALRSKLNTDLKITELGEKFSAKGYLNIDDITLKIDDYSLPYSYIKTTFDKNTIKTQSNIYISKDELLKTNNSMSVGKKTKIDLNIKTDKISLSNAKLLAESILDMLSIKNDVKSAIASGYFNCDFNLKSDLKSVQSSGKLQLQNGSVKYPKLGLNLTDTVSLLDFTGNKITIKDTHTYLNGSKLAISGTIDSKTNTNVKVTSDPIKIPDVIKLAKQFGIIKEQDIKDYSFNGGVLTLLLELKGDFKNIIPNADIQLQKLAMAIKSLNMPINIEKISIKAQPDKKDKNNFIATIDAQNFKASMKNPAFAISAPACKINADSKTLNLEPFTIDAQGTKIATAGKIENYMTKPQISFATSGNIAPQTVLAFVPTQNKKYVTYQGQMPFSAKIDGGLDDIKLTGSVTSNSKNRISVVDIKNIKGLENKLETDLNLKNNTLNINNLAIKSKGSNIAYITGKITQLNSKNPQLSPLNIIIPQKLSLVITALGNLALDVDGNLSLTSNIYSPQINGNANIANLNYPQYKASATSAKIDFKKSTIDAQAQGIKISDSDFSGNAQISSNFGKIITINSLNFTSNYINADTLTKLTSSMPNTQTTAGPSLPLGIKKGTAKIAKLKSGTLEAQNITFDFNLYNNLFTLSNIIATFADGNITGNATYNIANTKVTVDGVGKSINAKKAASCFVGGTSIIIGGTANGIAKLNFRGSTLDQQMRTLNGQVMFDIANGQYGEAARFERFLHAGNLLSQSLLNWNINQTISAVTNRNTGEFKKIEGKISLANGWANITSLESSGPNMSLYITGKYNLLTENSDIKVLGKISSSIVSVLGPLGSFSLNKVVEKLPDTGLAILNTIKTIAPTNPLFADISENDLAKIPALSTVSNNSTSKDFQVLINGPLSKTTSIKSFKWANTQASTTN